jgi:hypothetical protein
MNAKWMKNVEYNMDVREIWCWTHCIVKDTLYFINLSNIDME